MFGDDAFTYDDGFRMGGLYVSWKCDHAQAFFPLLSCTVIFCYKHVTVLVHTRHTHEKGV